MDFSHPVLQGKGFWRIYKHRTNFVDSSAGAGKARHGIIYKASRSHWWKGQNKGLENTLAPTQGTKRKPTYGSSKSHLSKQVKEDYNNIMFIYYTRYNYNAMLNVKLWRPKYQWFLHHHSPRCQTVPWVRCDCPKASQIFSWKEGSAARMFWMCFRSRQHSEQELEVAVITSYLYTKSNNQRNVKGVVSECGACLQYTYQGCIYTIYIHPSDLQPTPTRCCLKTSHFHLPQVVRSHNLLANVGFFLRRFKSLKPYKLPDLPLPICR